jgi:hypothetical protein
MTDAIIVDVVVSVWNRPEDTRNCLVNLLKFTPGARFIIYDSGSDRDTERLLQEFADSIEDRALLMRDDSNIGFVRSVNRGLARGEAPFLALVRNTTEVSEGWLDPLLAFASTHPEAGILLPCLSSAVAECRGPIEVARGSFAAMVISRELYRQIGGFDEGLDGGEWCLKDYTRRACARGFLTYQVPGPLITFHQEVVMGSERRRKETLERTMATFKERWGEGKSYIVHVPKGVTLDLLRQKIDIMAKGSRHGDSYRVLIPAVLYKEAHQAGLDGVHENVRLVPLPRFSGSIGKKRAFEKALSESPEAVAVSGVDGIAFPWRDSYLSFAELSDRISSSYRTAAAPEALPAELQSPEASPIP